MRSAMPMAQAVKLCPSLVIVPPDFSRYKAASTAIFNIYREVTPLVEPLSLDEAYLDVTENSWSEPLATRVAKRLKERIRDATGLTASAGVAPNKFLAKIASGWRKEKDGWSHRDSRRPRGPFSSSCRRCAVGRWARPAERCGDAAQPSRRCPGHREARREAVAQADWCGRSRTASTTAVVRITAEISGRRNTYAKDLTDIDNDPARNR